MSPTSYLLLYSAMFGCVGQDSNLRPPAYETDELPDCSTPQYDFGLIYSAKEPVSVPTGLAAHYGPLRIVARLAPHEFKTVTHGFVLSA